MRPDASIKTAKFFKAYPSEVNNFSKMADQISQNQTRFEKAVTGFVSYFNSSCKKVPSLLRKIFSSNLHF